MIEKVLSKEDIFLKKYCTEFYGNISWQNMSTISTQLNYTSHEYKNELRKTNLCLLRGAESFLLSVHDKDTEETPIHFVPFQGD